MKFEDAIEHVLKYEGGFVNNPNDPGGQTKFGISKRSYPDINIPLLTKEEAIEIYRRDFWDRCNIESLPAGLRLIVFDSAVNQGPSAAIGLLQAALGVKVDGALGPDTLKAVSAANTEKLLVTYAKFRLTRYIENPKFPIFGKGWVQRLVDVATISGVRVGEMKG